MQQAVLDANVNFSCWLVEFPANAESSAKHKKKLVCSYLSLNTEKVHTNAQVKASNSSQGL